METLYARDNYFTGDATRNILCSPRNNGVRSFSDSGESFGISRGIRVLHRNVRISSSVFRFCSFPLQKRAIAAIDRTAEKLTVLLCIIERGIDIVAVVRYSRN